jgi:hypothetical protein
MSPIPESDQDGTACPNPRRTGIDFTLLRVSATARVSDACVGKPGVPHVSALLRDVGIPWPVRMRILDSAWKNGPLEPALSAAEGAASRIRREQRPLHPEFRWAEVMSFQPR